MTPFAMPAPIPVDAGIPPPNPPNGLSPSEIAPGSGTSRFQEILDKEGAARTSQPKSRSSNRSEDASTRETDRDHQAGAAEKSAVNGTSDGPKEASPQGSDNGEGGDAQTQADAQAKDPAEGLQEGAQDVMAVVNGPTDLLAMLAASQGGLAAMDDGVADKPGMEMALMNGAQQGGSPMLNAMMRNAAGGKTPTQIGDAAAAAMAEASSEGEGDDGVPLLKGMVFGGGDTKSLQELLVNGKGGDASAKTALLGGAGADNLLKAASNLSAQGGGGDSFTQWMSAATEGKTTVNSNDQGLFKQPLTPASPRFGDDLASRMGRMQFISRPGQMEQVRVQLHPQELGTVKMSMHVDNESKVHISISAESEAAKDLLKGQMNQLKEALGRQGLELGEMTVDIGSERFQEGSAEQGSGENGANRPGFSAEDESHVDGEAAVLDRVLHLNAHGAGLNIVA